MCFLRHIQQGEGKKPTQNDRVSRAKSLATSQIPSVGILNLKSWAWIHRRPCRLPTPNPHKLVENFRDWHRGLVPILVPIRRCVTHNSPTHYHHHFQKKNDRQNANKKPHACSSINSQHRNNSTLGWSKSKIWSLGNEKYQMKTNVLWSFVRGPTPGSYPKA